MKITDIFLTYSNEPKCLFCQGELIFSNEKSPSAYEEYDCEKCEEGFTILMNHLGPSHFIFSIFDREVVVNLNTEKVAIVQHLNIVLNKLIWLPLFDFNFSDKEKLFEKIKIYTLIS